MIEIHEMDTTPIVGPWRIPKGWEWIPLSDVISLEYGKALPTRTRRSEGIYPVFGSGGQVGTHASAITNSPVIVVGRKGSIGAVFFSEEACWPIDTTYYIDQFASFVDPKYIYFFMKILPLSSINKAAAIPGLNRDDIYTFPTPIPFPNNPIRSLDIQRRIVDRIESLLADLKEAENTLDSIRQDIDQVISSASSEVFKEATKNANPVPLGRVTTKIGSGSTPRGAHYEETGIPFIRSLNVLWNRFSDKDLKFIKPVVHSHMRGTEVQGGDVLLNITGASIGRSCCPPEYYLPANVSQHVTIIRPTEALRSRFLMYWLTNSDTQQIISNLQSGATRQALTQAQIAQFQIPLPDPIQQEQIVNYLDSIQEGVNELQNMLREDEEILHQVEQGILNQAFRGEL